MSAVSEHTPCTNKLLEERQAASAANTHVPTKKQLEDLQAAKVANAAEIERLNAMIKLQLQEIHSLTSKYSVVICSPS
jgi:hypothetical protein